VPAELLGWAAGAGAAYAALSLLLDDVFPFSMYSMYSVTAARRAGAVPVFLADGREDRFDRYAGFSGIDARRVNPPPDTCSLEWRVNELRRWLEQNPSRGGEGPVRVEVGYRLLALGEGGRLVERVAVRGNPLLLKRADRPDIVTGREAQVSLQHAVACALLLGKAGLDEFTDACVNDPKVKAMRGRISVAPDDALPTIAAEVDIVTSDGKSHRTSTRAARGSSANPQKDGEIEQKLRDEAGRWSPGYDARPLIDAIWALERSADVRDLLALARP